MIKEKVKLIKNTKGITLIALIITIIVMLILAAVTISITLKSGLFDITGKATKDWKKAQNLEKNLTNGEIIIGNETYANIDEYLNRNQNITNDENTGDAVVPVLGFVITFLILAGQAFTTKENVTTVEFPEENPTQTGKNFTGWYYDDECTNEAQEGDAITGNTTLYAGWEEDEAQVAVITNKKNGADVFNYNSGRGVSEILTYQTTKEISSCTIVEVNDEDYIDRTDGEDTKQFYTTNTFSFEKNTTDNTNAVFKIIDNNQITVNGSHTYAIKKALIRIRIDFIDGTYDTDSFILSMTRPPCLAKGTKIKLKDGSEKEIQDVTYDDELLVWDFDNGCLASAKPLWIKKRHVTEEYNYLKFENGSELKTIHQHRIFNKELGKFTYPMLDETPIGTTTITSSGTETKLISKEIIKEEVEYYNIITNYHINIFANNILTSCRLSNLYEIKNMKYVKDGRKLASREEYKDILEKYFEGLRIAEQPKEVNRENDINFENTLEEYVKRLIQNEKQM